MGKTFGCEDVTRLLGLYHYGELGRAEAELVGLHVSGCAACRAELEAVRRAVGMVSPDTPSPAESRRVSAAVMARIAHAPRSPLLRFAPTLAATAFAVVVALVFNFKGPLTFSGEPYPTGAGVQVLMVSAKLDLLENYDVVSQMDVLEELDTLEELEEL